MDFAVPPSHRMKMKECEKRDKYLDFAWELKKNKTMEHKGDSDPDYKWWPQNDPQRLGKEDRSVGNRRMSWVYPNHSIVEVSQNTEKSPGDEELALIQIPLKDDQLTL